MLRHDLHITGEPAVDIYKDYYGNEIGAFTHAETHTSLTIDSRLEVITKARPAIRDEVVARYKRLGLPTNWAGMNSHLTAQFGANGEIQRVEISYTRDPAQQYLKYAAMYDSGLSVTQAVHGQ